MTTAPSTITPTETSDPTVEALEQAWQLPAVEPVRPAHVRSRRATAVVRASNAGYSPLELVTFALFVTMIGGLAAMVTQQIFG
jgi:hypothetical protein